MELAIAGRSLCCKSGDPVALAQASDSASFPMIMSVWGRMSCNCLLNN